eukprot:196005_1
MMCELCGLKNHWKWNYPAENEQISSGHAMHNKGKAILNGRQGGVMSNLFIHQSVLLDEYVKHHRILNGYVCHKEQRKHKCDKHQAPHIIASPLLINLSIKRYACRLDIRYSLDSSVMLAVPL